MYIIYVLIFKQHMTLYGERKYDVKCINYISPKIVKLCRILNSVIYTKLKIGKQLSSEFKGNQG